ncbi:unnamed protein product [Periconia digitata]|uniref:Uncharacterized protein n=1 Tax=Periconia digitata TaxID=1303443 RepID=A0A9W4UJD4_9PLEO|nr:unnamed protein product [Periconia digitata]
MVVYINSAPIDSGKGILRTKVLRRNDPIKSYRCRINNQRQLRCGGGLAQDVVGVSVAVGCLCAYVA